MHLRFLICFKFQGKADIYLALHFLVFPEHFQGKDHLQKASCRSSLFQQAGPSRWSRLIAKTMIHRCCLQVFKLGAIHIFSPFDCPLNLLHPSFTVVNRYTIYEVCCKWHQDKIEKEKNNASPKNEDESEKKGKGRWVGLSSGSLLRANQSQTSALPRQPAKPRVSGGSFLFIFHTTQC